MHLHGSGGMCSCIACCSASATCSHQMCHCSLSNSACGVLLLQGLQATLFERLQALHGDAVSSLLTVQYRMHAAIMTWASQALYEGRLSAHASVAGHTLADLLVCACACRSAWPHVHTLTHACCMQLPPIAAPGRGHHLRLLSPGAAAQA